MRPTDANLCRDAAGTCAMSPCRHLLQIVLRLSNRSSRWDLRLRSLHKAQANGTFETSTVHEVQTHPHVKLILERVKRLEDLVIESLEVRREGHLAITGQLELLRGDFVNGVPHGGLSRFQVTLLSAVEFSM